jgi:hypothetical protein
MTAPTLLALAGPLDTMLSRGEVTLVEDNGRGGVEKVTALADIAAPPDRVRAKLVDFDAYPGWMHGSLKAQSTAVGPGIVDVEFLVKAPGPNVRYTARITMDEATRTITAVATGRNLQGSKWIWHLEPLPGGGTRVYREAKAGGIEDNWALDMLGEHKEVILLGVNLASPVIEVRSLEKACEDG